MDGKRQGKRRNRYLPYLAAFMAVAFVFTLPKQANLKGDPQPNDCLIEAVEAQVAYLAKHRLEHLTWTRIVAVCVISWRPAGHALCVYQLPQSGAIWVYDALHGSRQLRVPPYTHDIKTLAQGLNDLDGRYHFARFLD